MIEIEWIELLFIALIFFVFGVAFKEVIDILRQDQKPIGKPQSFGSCYHDTMRGKKA